MKYHSKNYISESRLLAYIEQYKYINKNDRILEIGNGAGIFKTIAEKFCYYRVIDIDKSTRPDYLGDISDSKFVHSIKESFTCIFCCQVLEHMPLEKAQMAINNIFSLKPKLVVISIPDNREFFRLGFHMPFLHFKKVITIPFTGRDDNILNHPLHHWGLCSKNKKEIFKLLSDRKNKYVLDKHYRFFERPTQHFFIYRKKEK